MSEFKQGVPKESGWYFIRLVRSDGTMIKPIPGSSLLGEDVVWVNRNEHSNVVRFCRCWDFIDDDRGMTEFELYAKHHEDPQPPHYRPDERSDRAKSMSRERHLNVASVNNPHIANAYFLKVELPA